MGVPTLEYHLALRWICLASYILGHSFHRKQTANRVEHVPDVDR